ncbi:uncharacterized protein VTP21DRAFT_7179 [Calcarisporiella thermophila]|uniref:uncharacterized protein n=1 Tax=Calcarisporiella thermophila TaxID=911321 RepID=UPI0037444621
MYLLTTFIFFLICIEVATTHPLCIDFPEPDDLSRHTYTPCPVVHHALNRRQNAFNANNAFNFHLNCNASQELCVKVERGFTRVGEILSTYYFNFTAPIRVNASFYEFCKVEPGKHTACASDGMASQIGYASAARGILMTDDDAVSRIYPQALVKQFQLNPQPGYHEYDINCNFNAELKWKFESSPEEPGEISFEHIVLHELLHGLGFQTYWRKYSTAVSHNFLYPIGISLVNHSMTNIYTSNFEGALDRYLMVVPKMIHATEYTKQIDAAARILFSRNTTSREFFNAVESAPEFQPARDMLNYSQTRDALALLPYGGKAPDDFIFMESSIIPYKAGASLSHLCLEKYGKSADRLMIASQQDPNNMPLLVPDVNGQGGSIGPLVLRAMASIGYLTKQQLPTPPIPKLVTI